MKSKFLKMLMTSCATITLLSLALAPMPMRVTAQTGPAQIEPTAGQWQTWLLKSGDQLRLPAPPNQAVTQAEIKQLKALEAKRDAKALDQIAYWNTGAPAYRWNEILVNEGLKRNMNVMVAGRALALMDAAIYDATIAAWDSKYAHARPRPSDFDTSLTTVIPIPNSPAYPSEHAVTAGAAAAVLGYLFPDDAKRFADTATEASNAFLTAGVQYPSDVKAGLELGRKVADLAIARAKADGSDAKWAGAVPTATGQWTGENPVLPMMGTWKTWVLESGDALRPAPPLAYDSPELAAEMKELKEFKRTPKSNADGFFWEYGSGGLRNYWLWNEQASRKLLEYGWGDNAPRAARALTLMNIAFYDATVACWDAKYAYWAIRPFQLDPEFKPLFTTPNHPGYPAAHSCLSAAAAKALGYLFPRDAASFDALAKQAGESRIAAGIHFRSDVTAGQTLGEAVAQKVIERAMADGADVK